MTAAIFEIHLRDHRALTDRGITLASSEHWLFKQAITSTVSPLFKLVTGMFGHGTGRPIPLRLHWVVTLWIAAACLASKGKPGNLWNRTRVSTERGRKFAPKRSSWTCQGGSGTAESICLLIAPIPEIFAIIRDHKRSPKHWELERWSSLIPGTPCSDIFHYEAVLNLPLLPLFFPIFCMNAYLMITLSSWFWNPKSTPHNNLFHTKNGVNVWVFHAASENQHEWTLTVFSYT